MGLMYRKVINIGDQRFKKLSKGKSDKKRHQKHKQKGRNQQMNEWINK